MEIHLRPMQLISRLWKRRGFRLLTSWARLGDDAADYRIPDTITKVSGPIVGGGGEAAKGWVQVPQGSAVDGHFVAFSQDDAVRSIDRFLGSLLDGNPASR